MKDNMPLIFISAIGLLFLFLGISMSWLQAAVQVDVYRRQGVEMTTFEVFMGAKPVERYVREPK
jgi:hypothetical protein